MERFYRFWTQLQVMLQWLVLPGCVESMMRNGWLHYRPNMFLQRLVDAGSKDWAKELVEGS